MNDKDEVAQKGLTQFEQSLKVRLRQEPPLELRMLVVGRDEGRSRLLRTVAWLGAVAAVVAISMFLRHFNRSRSGSLVSAENATVVLAASQEAYFWLGGSSSGGESDFTSILLLDYRTLRPLSVQAGDIVLDKRVQTLRSDSLFFLDGTALDAVSMNESFRLMRDQELETYRQLTAADALPASGWTRLMEFARLGNDEAIDLLEARGVERNLDLETPEASSWSPRSVAGIHSLAMQLTESNPYCEHVIRNLGESRHPLALRILFDLVRDDARTIKLRKVALESATAIADAAALGFLKRAREASLPESLRHASEMREAYCLNQYNSNIEESK